MDYILTVSGIGAKVLNFTKVVSILVLMDYILTVYQLYKLSRVRNFLSFNPCFNGLHTYGVTNAKLIEFLLNPNFFAARFSLILHFT